MLEARLVKAVYRNGVLQLLEPTNLAEGTVVHVRMEPITEIPMPDVASLSMSAVYYPTRAQPFSRLDPLVGIIAIGGDALIDSEALYDEDWS